jgi:hypothetical protein
MRVRLLIGVVAAAALALSGCGTSSESGSPFAAKPQQNSGSSTEEQPKAEEKKAEPQAKGTLNDIDQASRKAGTAKVSGTLVVTTGGQQMTLSTMEGSVDFGNKKSHTITKMASPDGNGQSGGTEVIVDGTSAYLRYDMGGQLGPWMKFDLTAMLGQRGANDMGSYIALMAGITEQQEIGSENVRGVATTHYKVTVDPARVVEKYPEMKDFIDAMMKAAESIVPGSTKGVAEESMKPSQYDVWVDQAGLINRVSQDFTTKTEDGNEVSGKSSTEYFEYGGKVDIIVPRVG